MKNLDPQVACAFAQFGTQENMSSKFGWSEELDTYIKLAQLFEKNHKLKAKFLSVDYEADYWGHICEWPDELDRFWDCHKSLFLRVVKQQ